MTVLFMTVQQAKDGSDFSFMKLLPDNAWEKNVFGRIPQGSRVRIVQRSDGQPESQDAFTQVTVRP